MSTTPGWYPDPDGEDTLRHWDGRRWSARTATEAELGIAPPARRKGLPGWAGLGLVGLLAVAVAWSALLLTGKPPAEVVPTSAAPSTPPPFEGDACADGVDVIAGGPPDHDYSVLSARHLRVPRPQGWREQSTFRTQWLSLATLRYQDSPAAAGWANVVLVGSVRRSGAFPDLRTTAQRASECYAKAYHDKGKRTVVDDEKTTIDGASAWRYRVQSVGEVTGVSEVHVVDAGDPDSFDLIITDAVKGDPAESMLAQLPGKATVKR